MDATDGIGRPHRVNFINEVRPRISGSRNNLRVCPFLGRLFACRRIMMNKYHGDDSGYRIVNPRRSPAG